MPWLTECYQWRLLQRLAASLLSRKAYALPSARGWETAERDIPSYHDRTLEYELRKLLLLRHSDVSLVHEDLRRCRVELSKLCDLLESAVNPSFIKTDTGSERYPHLHGIVRYCDDPGVKKSCAAFDLAIGSKVTLFNLPRANREQQLQAVAKCNHILDRIWQKYETPTSACAGKLEHHSWKDSKIRDVASTVLSLIFERFSCDASHELLVKVAVNSLENGKYPMLQLFLSPCMHTDNWQEISCGYNQNVIYMKEFDDDLCREMRQFAGPDQELHIFADQRRLMGAWLLSPFGKPSIQSQEKLSLGEAIARGYFKPMTYNSFDVQPSIPRHTLGQKRALAVKLGYCLMDFFDSNLNSENIHFVGLCGNNIDTERLYVSFTSKLPSLPSFRIFKAGHPILLAFAKILIELEDGEHLPININNEYGPENTQVWGKFFAYVQLMESERNDSYLEAILGCLIVHTQLRAVDACTPGGDNLIRRKLYQFIVGKLELALEECTPRTNSRRARPSSPSAPHIQERSNSLRKRSTSSSNGTSMGPLQKRVRGSDATEDEINVVALSCEGGSGLPTTQQRLQSRAATYSEEAYDSLDADSKPSTKHHGDHGNVWDKPPPSRESFEIAIICALPLEYNAISILFDHFWDRHGDPYGKAKGDSNTYRTGRMGGVNVVLLLLPGTGKVVAASAAAGIKVSYTGLKQVLLTGICGGVPNTGSKNQASDDILLGDVIISTSIVQCDLGRRFPDSFQVKDDLETTLPRARTHIRSMLAPLKAKYVREHVERRAAHFLEQVQAGNKEYTYPGAATDRLFHASYRHKHQRQEQCSRCANCHRTSDLVCESSRSLSCYQLGCDDEYVVKRDRLDRNRQLERTGRVREAQAPLIFLGRVGSGDTILKCGEERDKMARQHDIISIEMEAAGIWEDLPCMVVKGVCDYADSHKNKTWQDFSAATAACVVKALLERYIRTT